MNYPKLPSFRLDGKRALITGAGRGIGMGASIALAESGADVTLVSRTETELKDLTKHINNQGYQSSYEVLDVSNEDEVSNFINTNSPFDILINNAGTNRPAKLIDTKIEDFVYVMSLNVRSVINLTRLVVKKMLDANIIVITEKNLPEVIKKVKAGMGEFVIYGLDPASFKNLALNLEEIKRYIEQQKEVILYYEEAVKPKENK